MFICFQTISKNFPEIEQMIKNQAKIVKESVADATQVQALEAKIASIQEGMFSLYYFFKFKVALFYNVWILCRPQQR